MFFPEMIGLNPQNINRLKALEPLWIHQLTMYLIRKHSQIDSSDLQISIFFNA